MILSGVGSMSMSVQQDPATRPSVPVAVAAAARSEHLARLWQNAMQLLDNVEQVTPEEFRWQESHYDHDSRQGRELLFLIANHGWVRATSETVDISRADAVDTSIKIDIDLDQITHEVFRNRSGVFWLPVTVLPPQAASDSHRVLEQHHLELDPFATVTDAAGELLPMLPTADVRHQMSAAMAEIIVNMAVARWLGPGEERPTATRDQRLLLSAAIYRLLRRGPAKVGGADGLESRAEQRTDAGSMHYAAASIPDRTGPVKEGSTSRIDNARGELLRLLGSYNQLLHDHATGNTGGRPDNSATSDAPPSSLELARRELARRAVKVLTALAESIVVVVPVDRDSAPTVLTVRVPTRSLNSNSGWKLSRPSTWMLRPLGHLEIDLLVPTADADRQVQVHLPDGISFEETYGTEGKGIERPRMDIEVRRPQPLEDLAVLMGQILDPRQRKWPSALQQCLADLAKSKMGAARETLRQYDVVPTSGQSAYSASDRRAATSKARKTLKDLRVAIDRPYTSDVAALAELKDVSGSFMRETLSLFRRTSAERPSPRTVVARTDMIEDVYQRAIPRSAKIHIDVVVTDTKYFSIARFSGRMSLLVMSVVLAFLAASRLIAHNEVPSPEVLAIVLTLFSAIQAGQMEGPDRSTLRGLLSAAGNWLIAASILPAVILAVALAFPHGGWIPTIWAGICISLQLLFQLAMLRGPLTATGSPRPQQRRRFSTVSLDYRPFEALRSDYWRSTTADALMIGRTASAYVTWQKAAPPQLKPLLNWYPNSAVPDEPANALAFLWSGTFRQATTFVVFSTEPDGKWKHNANIVRKLDLDPDKLAPLESITNTIDVFLGIEQDKMVQISSHPLTGVLGAAAHKLIVLEVQLPVPEPVAGYDGRTWARVRVALRGNEDVQRLASFLGAINDCSTIAQDRHDCVVAVQTIPTEGPRVITGSLPEHGHSVKKAQLVLASDLDVVNAGADKAAPPGSFVWRNLTICADARSNIERDIIQGIAAVRPELQLAGLTYALIHGMAVVVMLAREHQGDSIRHKANIEADLQHVPTLSNLKLRVLLDKELSNSELEPVGKYPLLRVHFRLQDRPGGLLTVLEALNKALGDQQPPIAPGDWSISYARTQAAVGRAALARLTIRLHTDAQKLKSWDFEEIERKVRTLVGLQAPGTPHTNTFGNQLDIPEDPVISVSLITTPAGTSLGRVEERASITEGTDVPTNRNLEVAAAAGITVPRNSNAPTAGSGETLDGSDRRDDNGNHGEGEPPEPPGGSAADGGGSGPRPRYLKGQCPQTIPVGMPFSLLAGIVLAPGPNSARMKSFDVPPGGLDVLLVAYAPELRLLSDQRQYVHVPADNDSEPVMFELRADSPGPRSVSLTAWLSGNYLGELVVDITAERDAPVGQDREVHAEMTTEATEGAVSLVVRYDQKQHAYRFEFRDEDNPAEVTSNLAYDPGPLVEQLIAGLDSLAKGRSGYNPDQARKYLQQRGANLWRELVPEPLRAQFWDRQERIRQLTILADKDAVPWELLYPRDSGHDEGFLVDQFPVTRAVFGRRLPRRLSLRPARFVLPSSLPEARREIETMRQLLDPGQPPGMVVSALTPLQALIESGDFGLLHFACHNRFDPTGGSSITLDNVPFTPELLTTAAIDRVLASSAPTVFINACRSAGFSATYNRLDGWASKFLEAGAAAFIGSLWAVSDGAAREFAQELYRQLRAGSALGNAVMQARQVAASQPDDPTWLAYTVYGDPRATVSQRP